MEREAGSSIVSRSFHRCIKPNMRKVPDVFDNDFVLKQLRWVWCLQLYTHMRLAYYKCHMYLYAFMHSLHVIHCCL